MDGSEAPAKALEKLACFTRMLAWRAAHLSWDQQIRLQSAIASPTTAKPQITQAAAITTPPPEDRGRFVIHGSRPYRRRTVPAFRATPGAHRSQRKELCAMRSALEQKNIFQQASDSRRPCESVFAWLLSATDNGRNKNLKSINSTVIIPYESAIAFKKEISSNEKAAQSDLQPTARLFSAGPRPHPILSAI